MNLLFSLVVVLFTLPAHAEWFVEAFGGKGWNLNSDLTLSQPGHSTELKYKDVLWDDRSFVPSPYYGYRIGYFFESPSWLGLRLQFLHHKAIARTVRDYHAQGILNGIAVDGPATLNATVQWFEVTHGLNLITLAAIGRLGFAKGDGFPRGRAQLYGGAGIGPVVTHAESTVRGLNHETPYTLQGRPSFEAFAGLRFFATPRWLGLLEYKLTHAPVSADIAGGTIATRFTSHHLTFGIGFSGK